MIDKALAMAEAVMGVDARIGTALMDAGYWSEDNAALETADCAYLIATTKDWKQRNPLRHVHRKKKPLPPIRFTVEIRHIRPRQVLPQPRESARCRPVKRGSERDDGILQQALNTIK